MSIYMAMEAEFAMQNAENRTQQEVAKFTVFESETYDKNLQQEQADLAADSAAVSRNPKDPQYQEDFTADSQRFQNYNSISQNFLSSEQDSVSRLGDSVSEIGNMFKGLMQNFMDYTNSLIAQG